METVQVMLRDDRNGRMTVNVPTQPSFKVGDHITLRGSEDPEKLWLVTWRSQTTRPSDSIPRGWNNNI